jgi:hypothetical protein
MKTSALPWADGAKNTGKVDLKMVIGEMVLPAFNPIQGITSMPRVTGRRRAAHHHSFPCGSLDQNETSVRVIL